MELPLGWTIRITRKRRGGGQVSDETTIFELELRASDVMREAPYRYR
jgi:hypothetical protein